MTEEARSERTARLLAARLDELARALELAGVPAAASARLLETASVATLHAVTLDLLSAEQAPAARPAAAERQPETAARPRAPERVAA
jgi:hypothetical protein